MYRHGYQNVVPLKELEALIDCTTIQNYRCNKKLVVSLTPLPHNGSGALNDKDEACHTCKRKLNYPYQFCSLTCKVSNEEANSSGHTPQKRHNMEQLYLPNWEKNFQESNSTHYNIHHIPKWFPFGSYAESDLTSSSDPIPSANLSMPFYLKMTSWYFKKSKS
ncbi:uncharacterized protein LOC127252881 [Andrographis paniculata]|uniref:uncharacterized protein LOC127252881 n=1 Tax=Andrographis paniculata TaxID=175694 RepID=UPI0021E85629|nr:uncharacterized protein LOC127252881 [Andrographis paniculata]